MVVIDTNVPSVILNVLIINVLFAEVKSKRLLCKYLPKDIEMLHGNFKEFIKKKNGGLNLTVIIYGVNRREKKLILEIFDILMNY